MTDVGEAQEVKIQGKDSGGKEDHLIGQTPEAMTIEQSFSHFQASFCQQLVPSTAYACIHQPMMISSCWVMK